MAEASPWIAIVDDDPAVLKAYGGFKFRIVCGYPGSMEFPMVLARGEVDVISSA